MHVSACVGVCPAACNGVCRVMACVGVCPAACIGVCRVRVGVCRRVSACVGMCRRTMCVSATFDLHLAPVVTELRLNISCFWTGHNASVGMT